MSVVFDPHGTVAENVQTKEAQTLPATGPRLIFPTQGPYYSDNTFELYDGTTLLKEQVHYYKVLPYATGVVRTARRVHGAILIIDDKVSRSLQVTYHPVGINVASAQQKTDFVAANTVFTDKYWEDVIGEPYFPPVDIQFDWDNWCGEKELMDALGVLAEGLKYKPPKKDPLVVTTAPGYKDGYTATGVTFDGQTGRHLFGSAVNFRYDLGNYNNSQLGDYSLDVEWYLPKLQTATASTFYLMLNNNWGSIFTNVQLVYDMATQQFQAVLSRTQSQVETRWVLATIPFAKSLFAKPFRVKINRSLNQNRFDIYISNDGGTVGKINYDHNNPPANMLNVYTTYGIANALAGNTDVRTGTGDKQNGYMRIWGCPGFTADVGEDILGLLRIWYNLLRDSYDHSPAHDHVLRKDNPHDEEAGWIKALVRNGISADAVRVYNRTLPQLTTYINALAPTTASFVTKVRREVTSRALKGTIVGVEGLTQFTQGSDANNIRILSKFDKLTSWLVAQTDNVSVTAAQYIDIKAGTGVLRLYNDVRGLQWNNEKLLTHDTIGPYIPQGGAAAAGFTGVSTATITLTGKGIGSNPFVATWVAPSAADLSTLAMRKVTDDFGTDTTLAATPALIGKLAGNFTGKLLKARANINGTPLASSITLSKSMYGMSEVVDISDMLMPMSDAMELMIADYEDNPDHTHPASMFGITTATTTVLGTVKLGGLVNDNTLVLNGREVLEQKTRLDEVDTLSNDTLTPAVINILRYGTTGTGFVEGVEFEDFMVSIPENTYYCGGRRVVPAASFNLVDLFPGAYAGKTFYLYVDVAADGGGELSISADKLVENDTLTEIGQVTADDDSIIRANVYNVTRLGSFREFEEHVTNANAHIEKTADKNSLGLSSVRNIPAAKSNYKQGFTNALRDWQGVYLERPWTQTGNQLFYNNFGAAQTMMLGLSHRQAQGDYVLKASQVCDPANDNDGLAGLLLAQRTVGTDAHSLTLMTAPTGQWANGNGETVYHAIVIDAEKWPGIVIPAVTGRTAGNKMSQLAAGVHTVTRVGNVFTVDVASPIAGDATTDRFVIDFGALTVVASNSAGLNKVTSLSPLMLSKGIPTDFFKGTVFVGVLGQYKSKITYNFTQHPAVDTTNLYSTLGSLIDNVSPLARVRVVNGALATAGMTQAQIQTAVGTPVIPTLDGRGIVYTANNCSYYSLLKAYTMLMMRRST
ncbi:putative virion structural protein [Erwinia phage vB_EamM_Phobos]|uniref:virion structural protein n=1 Tax=Erwinia phage vB_EamM_Phobos TaxID=1883377 RepID=UPI00081D1E9D|nr:virion structural protein [Erwinia phage vB_EamM_Phobos]ANZ50362.1 putative virion structural protein [Erwinia phage vB_EamM_Phobos]